MPILAKSNGSEGGDFAKAPAGTHIATCVQIIELGTVTKKFMGQDKDLHEVRIVWELPYETAVFDQEKGEEPFLIGETYTLSTYEKAKLRGVIDAWLGKKLTEEQAAAYDITELLGKNCQVTISHDKAKNSDKVYANVIGVSGLAKGMTAPAPITPVKLLEFGNFDWEVYESLGKYLQDRIANSKEYGAILAAKNAEQRANATKTHGTTAAPAQTMADVEDDNLPDGVDKLQF